jgi:hypothetical protein
LDERTKSFRDSEFEGKNFEAAAAMLGLEGRYLALIGSPSDADAWPWESPGRCFTQLEPGIWSFDDARTLRASFGKDSPKRRARKRKRRVWNLDAGAVK